MFTKARFKLTAWYLLIIMTVSILFSLFIYRGVSFELERGLRRQIIHNVFPAPNNADFSVNTFFDQDVFDESLSRIKWQLFLVNLTILIISGVAGYFLAGKTLDPIEVMVDEQKRFISDASHELRTPLTVLKTEIEVSLRDKNLELNDAKKLLNSNLEEVNKIQTLTNYLLTLSRYQNIKNKLKFEQVQITKIASDVIEKLEPIANQKEIKLISKIKDCVFDANPTGINEIITILIDNAIKYSHKKGEIIISSKSDKKHITISVHDFGIGIKASDIPYIFNRFYRASAARNKEQIDGYGLGLSIAKTIVDLHNGKINIESNIGEGSTFIVKLPIHQVK